MRAILCTTFGLFAAAAHAQIISATVDILSPGEPGYDGLPLNLIVIDYFVDVAETDVWTASGTRVLTENGATLIYGDGEPNTPGIQPTVINSGLNQRFTTLVSQPRARNGNGRFNNCGATVAGAYSLPPVPSLSPTLFDAAWFGSPPSTLSQDGYVARIAIDLGPASDRRDFLTVTTDSVPADAIVYARCFTGFGLPGWGIATADIPNIVGTDWYLFDPVPEPTTIVLLASCVALLRGRTRS